MIIFITRNFYHHSDYCEREKSFTFGNLLVLLVRFAGLLCELFISEDAEVSDGTAGLALGHHLPEYLVYNLRGHLVLGHHQVLGNGGQLLVSFLSCSHLVLLFRSLQNESVERYWNMLLYIGTIDFRSL